MRPLRAWNGRSGNEQGMRYADVLHCCIHGSDSNRLTQYVGSLAVELQLLQVRMSSSSEKLSSEVWCVPT